MFLKLHFPNWVIYLWPPLWLVRQKWDVIGCRGWVVSECAGCPNFIFFIRENCICAMTRHHVEPNINILLTRNFPLDSYVRQWSHPLMIPSHCLWAKSNNRTRGQSEYGVTWFCFCFDYLVHMHGAVVVP